MLHLTEEDVRGLLTMADALREVEAALQDLGNGRAENRPRERVRGPHAVLNVMAASWPARGYYGFKYYTISRETVRFWFHLFDANTGALLAVLEANRLGQQRTGAASGIATKVLARKDAATLGLVGSGWQAESQLEAVCAVRGVREVRCHSRHGPRREAFAERMATSLGVDVLPVDSAEHAVKGADVVIAATSSASPVVQGQWLETGAHVNAIGANRLETRELDDETIRRCAFIAADSIEQAQMESGDLASPVSRGLLSWDRVAELAQVVAGRTRGRGTDQDITLFKSLGLAIEDVATAAFVYERAQKEGVGTEVQL
jgi:ornithine cyclodeaminase/alanine dehydrogenase-like protein (mu-crystallin family)